MALEISIPERISQLDKLSAEELKDMLNHPEMIDLFASDVAVTLREMRKDQQAELLRIANNNLQKKKEIELITSTNNELRNEIDTLTAMHNSLQQRKDEYLQV